MKLVDLKNVIATDLMIYDSSTKITHKNVYVNDDTFTSLKDKEVKKVTTGFNSSEKNLDNNLLHGLLICVQKSLKKIIRINVKNMLKNCLTMFAHCIRIKAQ